jgi:hypothetical protein
MVLVHRRVAEDAKTKNIFLSADPLESEADMRGRKKRLSFKASIALI